MVYCGLYVRMLLNRCKNSRVMLFINIKAKETQAKCGKIRSKVEECVMSDLESDHRHRRTGVR